MSYGGIYTLFEMIGISAGFKHVRVIICFEHENIGFVDFVANIFCHPTEIGNDADLIFAVAEEIHNAAMYVMRGFPSFYD